MPTVERALDYDPIFESSARRSNWSSICQSVKTRPVFILPDLNNNIKRRNADVSHLPQYNPVHYMCTTVLDQNRAKTSKETDTSLTTGKNCNCNYLCYNSNFPEVCKSQRQNADPCDCLITKDQKRQQNVACQTIYRESSAQTSPYMPDALLPENLCIIPELIYIAKYISGNENPEELEAQIVERIRRRRKWEKSLPEILSKKNLENCREILDIFEFEEWLFREREIEQRQILRLELVERVLKKRDAEYQQSSEKKVNNTLIRIREECNKKINHLRQLNARKLRKIHLKESKVSQKYKFDDIVTEYLDPTSDLIAPQVRFGVHPKRKHIKLYQKNFSTPNPNNVKGILKSSTELVCELQKYDHLALPRHARREICNGFYRDKNLSHLYDSIKYLRKAKATIFNPKFEFHNIRDKSKTKIHLEIQENIDFENCYENSILIQKLVKGRSVQKMLQRDRVHYKEIIKKGMIAMGWAHQECTCDIKAKETPEAKYIQRLDFKLDRLYEQRKVHALCLLAECKKRKMPGFLEGQEKTNEEIKEYENTYHKVFNKNEEKMTQYLENILAEVIEENCDNNAREYVQSVTDFISTEPSICRYYPKGSLSCAQCLPNQTRNDIIYPEIENKLSLLKKKMQQKRKLKKIHHEFYSDTDSSKTESVKSKEIESDVQTIRSNSWMELLDIPSEISEYLTFFSSSETESENTTSSSTQKIGQQTGLNTDLNYFPEYSLSDVISAQLELIVPVEVESTISLTDQTNNEKQ